MCFVLFQRRPSKATVVILKPRSFTATEYDGVLKGLRKPRSVVRMKNESETISWVQMTSRYPLFVILCMHAKYAVCALLVIVSWFG